MLIEVPELDRLERFRRIPLRHMNRSSRSSSDPFSNNSAADKDNDGPTSEEGSSEEIKEVQ